MEMVSGARNLIVAQIIDLDVFVPEKKVIKFTDLSGHNLKVKIEALKGKRKTGIMGWFLGRKIKMLEARMESHVHTFDITNMSFGASAYIIAHLEQFQALSRANANTVKEDDYRLVLGIIEEIATKSDKALTVDFLMKNLSFEQNVQLLSLATATITSFLQSNPQGAVEKKAEGQSE
jgi:hypothetical protein